MVTGDAYVAEYERRPDGTVLYWGGVPEPGPLGIVYVRAAAEGLRAETFRGRPLQDVPPAARDAVDRYRQAMAFVEAAERSTDDTAWSLDEETALDPHYHDGAGDE
jgi:hypothetical protein